jgi:uncharacterized protein involved in exopolysaccharide biosynthesis
MSRYYTTRLVFAAWPLMATTAVLGAVLALAFSITTPLQYSSSVRVLITQPNVAGLDPYTAIKSNERIASSLAELLYTTTFFNNILGRAEGFDAGYFPTDERSKRRAWRRSIETAIAAGSGIMTITAYHPDRSQARLLVDAAASELAAQAPNYFGASVRVQVIDAPLDSRWYARPDFVRNGSFGLLVGLLAGVAWVLARPPERLHG